MTQKVMLDAALVDIDVDFEVELCRPAAGARPFAGSYAARDGVLISCKTRDYFPNVYNLRFILGTVVIVRTTLNVAARFAKKNLVRSR